MSELRALMDAFFQHYLAERDLESTLSMLTEQVVTVGTGEHETARNKQEFRRLLEQEFTELPGQLRYEILDCTETHYGDSMGCLLAHFAVAMTWEHGVTEVFTRLTCTCVKEGGIWKIGSLHMSTPEPGQEENSFFPLYYGTSAAETLSGESGAMLMELISNALPGGIMGGYLDEGFPLYTINEKMLNNLGYTYEELIAATNEQMLRTIAPEDQKQVEQDIYAQLAKTNEYQVEYRAVGKDGRIIWVSDLGRKIVTSDGREAIISVITDITDRVEREKQLKLEAEQDPLTGLYNRKYTMNLIEQEFLQHKGGIFFIFDVDNFKPVNDTRGHLVGDEVLMKLARIIQKYAEHCAVAARFGGDEFVLFFYDSVPCETAAHLVREIQETFRNEMQVLTPDLNVSLSAGAAIRRRCETVQELYARADCALYQAKQKKGSLVFHNCQTSCEKDS